MNVYDVKPVRGEVQLKVHKKFPYGKIISLLLEGEDIFMEVNRRQAYYLRRRIEKMIGEMIEAHPVYYDGREGYLFKISMVKEYLSTKIDESNEQNRETKGGNKS